MGTVAEKKPRAAKKTKGVDVIERLINEESETGFAAIDGDLIDVLVTRVVRHPDNRSPCEESILAVMASFQSEGQIEPIVVRPGGMDSCGHTWQVISGETRMIAAHRLGWETLKARVALLDDAAALRVLAAANAARQDLDPIATARLIVRLCDPVERGGSGMSREEAGKMFDLKSGGAASNLVRLLELPPKWLDRVASGELPQSYARELLPLLLLGPDSAAWSDIDEAWTAHREDPQTWEAEAFRSREDLADAVDGALDEFSRPVEKSDGRKRSYYEETKSYEHHSIRFKLTPSLEEELRIVELPLGQNGAPIRRATNCELYDSFQVPAIKAAIAKKCKGKSVADDDEPAPAAKLTTKEQAAEDARRREEANEKLAKRIELWRAAWLRELAAVEIVKPERVDLATRLLVWQQRQVRVISHGDSQNLALDSAICEIWSIKDPWHLVTRGSGGSSKLVGELVAHWLRAPQRDGYDHPMPDERVEDLIDLLDVDLADKWLVMQSSGKRPERMQEFFELHNSEQLDTLGAELEVGVVGIAKKAGKVAAFMNAPKTLKLPRSLRSLRKRGAK